MRTMAEIFTSKGKGKRKESISIDFGSTQKGRSLCSVEFPQKAPSPTTPKPDPIAEHQELVRVRESELDPSLFNPETGEYFQRPPKPDLYQKRAAEHWVANALDAKRDTTRTVRAQGI
jgi:hypothetical protein